MNIFEIFNSKVATKPRAKSSKNVVETIGPDKNDPWEKGWRAGFRHNESNPYPAGSNEAKQWDDGYAEAEAQPNHYDESVESDMPDLEAVGEPVRSIMDAERRMAAGDRIFAAHEMDEEPFEIFNVGDLRGYTYDQVLAGPQGVAEAKMSKQQENDFDRMRYGAMSRKEYDAKWKKPLKSDDEVIYGKKKVKEQGVAEGSVSGYKEIEFVCVNPKFPEATDPKLQKQMHLGLQKIPGVIPLLQNWSDMSEGQTSLTAIYKDRESRQQILALAKRLGVSIDLEQPVSHDYVDRAVRGEHKGQQGVAEGSYKGTGGTFVDRIVGEIMNYRSLNNTNPKFANLSSAIKSKLKSLGEIKAKQIYQQALKQAAELSGKQGVAEAAPRMSANIVPGDNLQKLASAMAATIIKDGWDNTFRSLVDFYDFFGDHYGDHPAHDVFFDLDDKSQKAVIKAINKQVKAATGGDGGAYNGERNFEEGVAEGSLNESAVFLNPTTVVVGQAHGQPLELSPDTLKKIQDIAAKHGAWYEGNGTDRSYTKGQIDRYVGSWDDEVAKSASPNDPKWLYVLFANVDENNRVQRVGVDPKDTIFNRLLAGAQDNSFQGIGYTAQALQKFLQMASEGKYDFVKMSQQPATQENLTRFLKAGEALMWPSNWEQYPNRAGKIAKAATVDVRDQYLATRKAGVYVTGSGHLKAVQNITGQQGVAEGRAGVDDTDTVGFSVNSEAAYNAVMQRFGDAIDHDETSGIMYAPARIWPRIEMTAFDADPDSGAVRVEDDVINENLRNWFGKEKWVRMDTKGNIKGDCARGSEKEGKPKCLPQAKAHALGKKGRAAATQKKRREDPNPERRGAAINVNTKVREQDTLDEACWEGYHKEGMKTMFGKKYPNCVKNKNESLEIYIKRNECPGCGGLMVSESQLTEKKDACYHKVKSRYKVWPSAYASGALVRCRKVGADSWGSKSESATEAVNPAQQAAIAIAKKKKMDVAEAERNEMDTPAVQAALARMATRHNKEQWTKEQLAALGKKLATSKQNDVEEDQWHGENDAWSDGKGQWSDGRGQWDESTDADVANYLAEMKNAGYDIK